MKTILVFVSTLDGKVTRWGQPRVRAWSSLADQQYFTDLWKQNSLVVMGSNTYLKDPLPPATNQLLVVMTSHPSKFKNEEIPGQRIFSNQSPSQLVEYYEKAGYEQMMVVGGPHIATSFLKEQLIDEIWLTIEPKIFGTGGNFVIEEALDIALKLLSCAQLNEEGTLLTKYAVVK